MTVGDPLPFKVEGTHSLTLPLWSRIEPSLTVRAKQINELARQESDSEDISPTLFANPSHIEHA